MKFPREIMDMICDNMDGKSLVTVLTTGSAWYPSALRSIYKKGIHMNDDNKEQLQTYFNLSPVSPFYIPLVSTFECFIHGLCEMEFDLLNQIMNRFTGLTQVKIGSCDHILGTLDLQCHMSNVETLEIHDCTISNLAYIKLNDTKCVDVILSNCESKTSEFLDLIQEPRQIRRLKYDSDYFEDSYTNVFNEILLSNDLEVMTQLEVPYIDLKMDTFLDIMQKSTKLERLAFRVSLLNESCFTHFNKLQCLKYLELTGPPDLTNISTKSFEHLSNVTHLKLEWIHLEESHLIDISKMPALTHLEIIDCMIPDADVIGYTLTDIDSLILLHIDCRLIIPPWVEELSAYYISSLIKPYLRDKVTFLFHLEEADTDTDTDSESIYYPSETDSSSESEWDGYESDLSFDSDISNAQFDEY